MAVGLSIFLAGMALIALVSLFVAGPLFRPSSALAPAAEGDEGEHWDRRKRQALLAIKEAELDYRMGKLSDEDLATMRARFEAQALEAMAALERAGRRK